MNPKLVDKVMSIKRSGRKKPYTDAGLKRMSCARCGQQATHQWSACADDNLWRPICVSCDLELNELVLKFMNDPDTESKIAHYKETL